MNTTSSIPITVDEAGSGRPILILHGGGGPFTVAPIAAHFAGAAHTLVPTHPGWNGTPRPAELDSVSALAELYLDYLRERDLRDVMVIGSSFGGWVTSEIAVQDAERRVSGIVLLDGGGILVPEEPIRDISDLTPAGLAEFAWHDPAKGFRDPATIPPTQVEAQKQNMITMGVYSGATSQADPTLRDRIGAVEIPALVAWGESDRIFTPGYGEAYAKAFPKGRFELIREAGHLPQLEQPAATFALLDGFVAAV